MPGWIYTSDGRRIEKGSPEHVEYLGGQSTCPLVFGDEGVFRSPIDGKLYSGKAGMKEHNARHSVINNRDLAGLPVGFDPARTSAPLSTRARQELRTAIYQAALKGKYLEGQ